MNRNRNRQDHEVQPGKCIGQTPSIRASGRSRFGQPKPDQFLGWKVIRQQTPRHISTTHSVSLAVRNYATAHRRPLASDMAPQNSILCTHQLGSLCSSLFSCRQLPRLMEMPNALERMPAYWR